MNKLKLLIVCLTLSLTFSTDCQIRSDFSQSDGSDDWEFCNWSNNVDSDTPSNLVYDCDGNVQFGGYGNFGSGAEASTEIQDIPTHTSLTIKFDLFAIDSWDSEWFYVYVDDVEVYSQQFLWNVGTANDCGAGWMERSEYVEVNVAHVADIALIYLTSNLDEDSTNESWGIANFEVEYITDDECQDSEQKCNGVPDGNFCTIRSDFDQSIDSSEWHTCNWLNSFTSTNEELIYDCNGDVQFGGYGQFGKNAWASTSIPLIPDHSQLHIKFTLHAIDSWDSEYFYLYVDGAEAYTQQFFYDVGTSDDCGAGWLERDEEVDIYVDHTASQVDFYLTSNLNEDGTNESWGISDFVVEYVTDNECQVYDDLDECNEIILAAYGNKCSLFNDFDQLSAQVSGLLNTDAWTFDQTYSDPFTVCDQYNMLGGYGVFGSGATAETTISDIPTHSYLHITFTFYSVDSWDTETYYLQLDEVTLIEKAQQHNDGADICGAGWNERINYHDLVVPHSADSATFKFSSTLNQGSTDESWGISDFVVEYYTTDDCSWEYDSVPTASSLFGKNECLLKCELGQDQVEDFTTQDISNWVFDGADTTDVFNTCGDDYSMVGGYGIFGEGATASTTIDNLPEHAYLSLSFTLFIGDSWDSEYFQVYVDDEQVKNEDFWYGNADDNVCGAGWNEQWSYEQIYVPHSGDSVTIELSSTINQSSNDENWGFSDFKLTYFTDNDCGDNLPGDTCWFNVLNCDVVTVYEFCNYSGRRLEIDDKANCIDWDPQAICIPAGTSATIYDLCWFDGDFVEFTESQSCLLTTGSIEQEMELLSKQGNAKKNKKVSQHGLNSVVEVHH